MHIWLDWAWELIILDRPNKYLDRWARALDAQWFPFLRKEKLF